jgi:hypothetical protein
MRQVDVRESARQAIDPDTGFPMGPMIPGDEAVDSLKAKIEAEGFVPSKGDDILIQVHPETGEKFLGDGNHRVTALMELLEEGKLADEPIDVTVKVMTPADIEMLATPAANTKYLPSQVQDLPRVGRHSKLVPTVGKYADPYADGAPVLFLRQGDTIIHYDVTPGTKDYNRVLEWGRNQPRHMKALTVRGSDQLDPKMLKAYMDAEGIDAVKYGENILFTDTERLLREGKIVQFSGGNAVDEGLAAASRKLAQAKHEVRMTDTKAGNTGRWVISDMPLKPQTVRDEMAFWSRKFGVGAGKSYDDAFWVTRKLRGLVAKTLVNAVPETIRTGMPGRTDGVEDLRKLLVQMQIDPQKVRASMVSYLEDPSQENVLRLIQEAAMDINDHELALGLMAFQSKTGNTLEYGTINGGQNLTQGKRIDGGVANQPLLARMTRSYVQLPNGRALTAHLRRVRRAQTRKFKYSTRGFGKTNKQRRKLVAEFGNTIKDRAGAKSEEYANWLNMSEDEHFAIAYAVVRPNGELGDGLGAAGRFGRSMAEQWSRLRNVFSISMLAWRPIGWMGNEMLDNTWRGFMSDGLSYFTHPWRSFNASVETHRIASAAKKQDRYLTAIAGVQGSMADVARTGSPTDVIAAAERIIPDIGDHVKHVDEAADQMAEISRFMNDELIYNSDLVVTDIGSDLAKELLRQRRGAQAAKSFALPKGKILEMTVDDWDEITRTGLEVNLTHTFASSSTRHEWRLGVKRDTEELREYTGALGDVWAANKKSKEVELYLAQSADFGVDSTWAATQYVNTADWNKMAGPIRNMARNDLGATAADTMSDAALSQWYFKNKIGPYVRDIFGDVLTPETARTLGSEGTATVQVGAKTIALNLDDPDTVSDLVLAANGTDFVLPKSVVGVVNPRRTFGYGADGPKGWKTPFKWYHETAMEYAGNKVPAALQRKPAYFDSYRRFKENALRMMWTGEGKAPDHVLAAADTVASRKALEHIQKSFFFVETNTPFLKSMNSVFPFYSAMWEVGKSWAWTMPIANGAYGIGHARVLRTFDHIFNAFERNGLIVPGERDRETGRVTKWQFRLETSKSGIEPGVQSEVSNAAWLGLMAIPTMFEQIAEVATNLFADEDVDYDFSPDSISFNFNHPIEFFGKGGGLLPTARMSLGMQPAMAYPAGILNRLYLEPAAALAEGWLNDRMGWTSQSEESTTTEATNLAEFFIDNDVNDQRSFLALNRHVLLESGAITEDEYDLLIVGDMDLIKVTVPEGTQMMVPHTSLYGRIYEHVLAPYGDTSSIQEAITDYIPRNVQNMGKMLGLMNNDGSIEGMTAWIPNVIMGPTGTYQVGTATTEAMMITEMRTGLLQQRADAVEALAEMDGPLLLKLDGLEEGTPQYNEVLRELEAVRSSSDWKAKTAAIHAADDAWTAEIKEQMVSRAFVQTLAGVTLPFNPKFGDEEQLARDYWYNTRSAAELHMAGEPLYMPYDGRTVGDHLRLIEAWIADPTGSQSKLEFVNQHGGKASILSAITPKSYWGGQGEPNFKQTITEYFDDVESGDRKALPGDVWEYRYRSLVLQWEREGNIIEAYGNDPAVQAQMMLQDGHGYKLLTEEHDNRVRALEVEDELVNDGAYKRYSVEVADNYIEFVYNEQMDLLDDVDGAILSIELDEHPDDPAEIQSIVGTLKGVQATLREAVEKYSDEKYSDWDVSPRQQVLNAYYDKLTLYYADQEKMYQKVADADTDTERSLAYDNLAIWKALNDKPIVVMGFQMPSPEDKSWGAKSPEQQRVIVEKKVAGNLEWLSSKDVEHIMAVYPQAEQFLPASQAARDALLWKMRQEADLAREVRITGPKAGWNPSDSQEWIDNNFEQMLRDAGETGFLDGLQNYPIENFAIAGALPLGMDWIVPLATAIHRDLDAAEKGPQSNKAKAQQRWLFTTIQEQFANNPQLRQTIREWGIVAFGESDLESIVAKMMGNYRGSLN